MRQQNKIKCSSSEECVCDAEAHKHIRSTLRLKVHAHWTDDKNSEHVSFEQKWLVDSLARNFVPFSLFHMRSLFLKHFFPLCPKGDTHTKHRELWCVSVKCRKKRNSRVSYVFNLRQLWNVIFEPHFSHSLHCALVVSNECVWELNCNSSSTNGSDIIKKNIVFHY